MQVRPAALTGPPSMSLQAASTPLAPRVQVKLQASMSAGAAQHAAQSQSESVTRRAVGAAAKAASIGPYRHACDSGSGLLHFYVLRMAGSQLCKALHHGGE